MFLLMLTIYQLVVLFRVPLMLCIFVCGRRFWTWCKRRPFCACLNTVEGDQTANFDVYDANVYVERVNNDDAHRGD